jgi:hypothetical protein
MTQVAPISVDLKTASSMCGYSSKTLRRAIERGDLRAIGATRKIVILVDDLRDFLESHALDVSQSRLKSVNKKDKGTRVD